MNFIKRAYQNYKQKREVKRQVHKAWADFAVQVNAMREREDEAIWNELIKAEIIILPEKN